MHASCMVQARVFRKPRRRTKARSTGCCHPRDVGTIILLASIDLLLLLLHPSVDLILLLLHLSFHLIPLLLISSLLHLHYLLETGHNVFDFFDGLLPFLQTSAISAISADFCHSANGAKETHLVDEQLRTFPPTSLPTDANKREAGNNVLLFKPRPQKQRVSRHAENSLLPELTLLDADKFFRPIRCRSSHSVSRSSCIRRPIND